MTYPELYDWEAESLEERDQTESLIVAVFGEDLPLAGDALAPRGDDGEVEGLYF